MSRPALFKTVKVTKDGETEDPPQNEETKETPESSVFWFRSWARETTLVGQLLKFQYGVSVTQQCCVNVNFLV